MYDDPVHVAYIRTNQWMHAAELQAARVLGSVITPQVHGEAVYRDDWNARQRDIDFVTAMYRLRLSVQSVRGRLPDRRIGLALKRFDRAVPDLVDLRHIAEHFDSYDWGIGRLLRRGHLTSESPSYSWGPDDGGIRYRGKRLSIASALPHARRMHGEVMTVVHDAGRDVDLKEWPRVAWSPEASQAQD